VRLVTNKLRSFLDAISCLQAHASYLHNPRDLSLDSSGLQPVLFAVRGDRLRRFCTSSCLTRPDPACQFCFCATSWQVNGYMSVRVLMCSMASVCLLIVIGGNKTQEPNEAKGRESRSSPNVAERQCYLPSQWNNQY
jgi:hypothetical protein